VRYTAVAPASSSSALWPGNLLALAAPPLCWECGAPAPGGEPLCRDCRRSLHWLPADPVLLRPGGLECFAAVAYEGPARALVRALKFRSALAVVDAMAGQILAAAPPRLLAGAALVPVPGHPVRVRRSGFDQAERLAAALARRSGLQLRPCLERRGGAPAQTGRPRAVRLAAARGGMGLRAIADPPRRALLVDDVVTTGATLTASAAALRRAGTDAVAAVAYARTPGW
jgi:ComF family protein